MAYTPRLTAPSSSNPYYYSTINPFYPAHGMPNCTAYAYGRAYEILGRDPHLCLNDAGEWYEFSDGYSRGRTPRLGDILCFSGGSFSGKGHVCVVEEKLANGKIRTSNSALGGQTFYLDVHDRANNYAPSLGTGYTFQGFIHIYDEPAPPTTRKKMPLYMMLRRYYNV